MKPLFLKLFVCLACLSFTCSLPAAGGNNNKLYDKLIQQALEQGKDNTGAYEIENTKSKDIDISDLAKYLQSQSYLVCNSSTRFTNHYGRSAKVLDRMRFIPANELESFIFNTLRKGNGVPYAELKGPGSFVYPITKPNSYITTGKYSTVSGVLWSGEIVDGVLHGSGLGFIPAGADSKFFEATFYYGFSDKNIECKTLTLRTEGKAQINKSTIYYAIYISQIEKMADVPPGVEHARKVLSGSSLDGALIDEMYSKVLMLNGAGSDYEQFIKDNISDFARVEDKLRRQLDMCAETGAGSGETLTKLQTVVDALKVLKGLTLPLDSKYVKLSGLTYRWDKEAADRDTKTMDECCSIALKKSREPGNVLQAFYQRALSPATEREAALSNHIYDRITEWNKQVGTENAEKDRIWASLARVIDDEASYAPSGELTGGLGSSEWRHEKNGEIRFKNPDGNYLYYNIYYLKSGDNYTKDHYGVTNAGGKLSSLSNQSFKSYDEMIAAIQRLLR